MNTVATINDDSSGITYVVDMTGDRNDLLQQLHELPRPLAIQVCKEYGLDILAASFAAHALWEAIADLFLPFVKAMDRLVNPKK